MDVEKIKELMAEMARCGLSGLEWTGLGETLKLSRESGILAADLLPVSTSLPETVETDDKQNEEPKEVDGTAVTSPVVGVFFAASSPERDPYVNVGSVVKKGDVLCIIEAMKLMNEVVSETAGEIVEIYVANGEKVEYGQPLMLIR
ncbi:MAG: acetyl-CoA carboxylase biotin carboxyl carrier protein [Fastidiosipilaceae bacterium]|jgi:acetyl-CoA carboxylase biotin carboxyl carrier protein